MAVPSNIAVYKGIGGKFWQSKLVCWSQPGLMAGFRMGLVKPIESKQKVAQTWFYLPVVDWMEAVLNVSMQSVVTKD